MKSHMLLYRWILDEMGIRCCTSTTRDWKTITSRVKHEGFSFLTITLPTFAKDFERCLELGYVDSSLFTSFVKNGRLPAFLQGFSSQVFDRSSALLLKEPSIDAVQAIRQVSLLAGKIGLPCSDAREKAAMQKFIECEQDVRANCQSISQVYLEEFQEMAFRLFADVFSRVDHAIYHGQIIPKHGPGSTADRTFGNQKYNHKVWTERLEEIFLAGEFLYPSWSHFINDSPGVQYLEPENEIPVRVVSVPKTLKTPRIIAIEPTHMQYVQQGLMEVIVDGIQRDNLLRTIIGFQGQEVNHRMAWKGSVNGTLATLDLSEASDRVSNQHVKLLSASFPWVTKGIQACRSSKADVPGFGIVPLAKFASMGSALCFPMEAMVFTTLIFLGIQDVLNRRLTRVDFNRMRGKVRVYGDDIIVPVEYVHAVIHRLEAFGLKVNMDKSFWTGKFRESCGKEYYDGNDVSIVRQRTHLPQNRRHVPEIISTISLRDQLYRAGLWETVKKLDNLLDNILLGCYPVIGEHSQALGRFSFLGYETQRECQYLHVPLVKAYVVYSRIPRDNLEGPGALLKFFLKRSALPNADRKHLERAGRPACVGIKRRWVTPY